MEQETSILEKQLEVEAVCQRHHVERLELFGSALVSESDAQDYDFLVQLGEKSRGRLLEDFLGLAESLEEVLGKPVDLITERSLKNPYLRKSVLKQKKVVYERAHG